MSQITAPKDEVAIPAQRPMSKRQIQKRDPDGLMGEYKQFAVESGPQQLKWWAYLSSPKSSQRMSQIIVDSKRARK